MRAVRHRHLRFKQESFAAHINTAVFGAAALGGYLLDRQAWTGEGWIMGQPGQSPTDFIAAVGIGPALLNMGLTGAMGVAYVPVIIALQTSETQSARPP